MLCLTVKRLTLLLLLVAHHLNAMTYSNAINDSSWRSDTSVFACQLIHSVPYYGEAVFRTRAGEASAFYLRAQTSRFKAGEAKLVASAPVWMAEPQNEVLATIAMKQGRRPLWLNANLTELMLARLNAGMEVSFERNAWYDPKNVAGTALKMSSIGFREVYEDYLKCLSSLIPRNFDQLKRTVLLFPAGETDELPAPLTKKLDHILQLVKYDNKVRAFYVDGHTDSVGDRDENLELSKVRAELVVQYLSRRGIPEDWITLRWHGERYPVASNGDASGRARNRRVTVRLERIEEIEVLPLASANAN